MQIQSISYDQDYIIKSIMDLCGLERFDVDMTYGNGGFWKNLMEPMLKYDLDPQTPDTIKANSVEVPLHSSVIGSIMFDPPFLTYIKQGREHNSVMGKRFSGYWRYDELEDHYRGTIKEACGTAMRPDHARKILSRLYARIGVCSGPQAVAWLDDHFPGWRAA